MVLVLAKLNSAAKKEEVVDMRMTKTKGIVDEYI